MPKALEEITREAMDLPPRQRLALAEFLLESADAAADPEGATLWILAVAHGSRKPLYWISQRNQGA